MRTRGKTLAWRDCARLTVNAVRRASSKRGSPVWFSKSVTRTESRALKENAGLPYKSQTPRPLRKIRIAAAAATQVFHRLGRPRTATEGSEDTWVAGRSPDGTTPRAGGAISFTCAINR